MNTRDRFSFDLSSYTLLPQRLVYARTTKQRGVFFRVEAGLAAVINERQGCR